MLIYITDMNMYILTSTSNDQTKNSIHSVCLSTKTFFINSIDEGFLKRRNSPNVFKSNG